MHFETLSMEVVQKVKGLVGTRNFGTRSFGTTVEVLVVCRQQYMQVWYATLKLALRKSLDSLQVPCR